ncbi:MAG: RNA-binding transcriptional accessory protein [Anaerolineaceae bacterium]|nr:RNA-binding transcriptional accessory protein [Anaerolineaceae bacterium]
MPDFAKSIAKALNLRPEQVAAAIELLDEGATIPFIARYRKERTGTLDEEQLRQVQALLEKGRALEERRAAVIASVEEQGKMTPELLEKFQAADNMTALEDLYAPYKPKRRTRASIAREKGLQGLADMILMQARTPGDAEKMAQGFLNEQVLTTEDALAGARDIVAETISDHAEVRASTRRKAMQWGLLSAEKIEDAKDEKAVYEVYYEFSSRVDRLRPHQVLAINRGETEKVLRVKVTLEQKDWKGSIVDYFRPDLRSPFCGQLELAIEDAAERLLLPAIERDVRRELTVAGETHAIKVFASNLRALLGQPPLLGQTVLGLDPGFRTGTKLAVVGPTGKLLDTGTIYPHEPQRKWEESKAKLKDLIAKHGVTLISIGNGTASRETEQLAAELTRELSGVKYIITNEAGASVYSASPLARAEMPDLDVSIRGAVSIARRVQDPLAELVKIDPRSIGVGMYQHDVDQTALSEALTGVVEDVVNRVGVDVNTASPALLGYVSGIGSKLAERIVAYRDENGIFADREAIRQVPGLGPKAFEQSAGFLRIREGKNPLDASAIHPESYPVAEAVLKLAGVSADATLEQRKEAVTRLQQQPVHQLAEQIGCGVPTLQDILEQLIRPGRDPRQDAPAPILRSDVLKMDDLTQGMRLKGTVRNVVDFGIFVDIGVKQDGLLHRTQIPTGMTLQVGDIIDVTILKVEVERGRISLGMEKQ